MAKGGERLRRKPDGADDLLSYWAGVDFGPVTLSAGEKECFTRLNGELKALCKSLPESIQTDALLFLMQYYGIPIGAELHFFKNYYAPSWSIIYWLNKSRAGPGKVYREDLRMAFSVHAMALFLHSLDDHLNDGETPVSHLALLLRSQAWLILNLETDRLAARIDHGAQTARRFMDDYYSGTRCSEDPVSLDAYCELFRRQMATGFIVPVLLARKVSADESFPSAVAAAYGSFGIAWRLLDDVKDIEADMRKGQHSAVYVCLPDDIRRFWDAGAGKDNGKNRENKAAVVKYVSKKSIVETIFARIYRELRVATSVAKEYNMKGLANEFQYLSAPFSAFWGGP